MFATSSLVLAAEAPHNPLIPGLPDLIWGTVCFIVILLVFWKKFLPTIQKSLDERSELIEGGIKRAEVVQAEAAKTRAEYEEHLADARKEAAGLRDKARAERDQILAEARTDAQKEAETIIATAHAQTEADRAQAFDSLKGEIGLLAIDLASRVVGVSLDDDARAKGVVDSFIAELDKAEAK